jgi:hypothetical protein
MKLAIANYTQSSLRCCSTSFARLWRMRPSFSPIACSTQRSLSPASVSLQFDHQRQLQDRNFKRQLIVVQAFEAPNPKGMRRTIGAASGRAN